MSRALDNGYYHATPGRLRVRVTGIKKKKDVSKSLELLLASQPGISHVRANAITGNVLVNSTITRYRMRTCCNRSRTWDICRCFLQTPLALNS